MNDDPLAQLEALLTNAVDTVQSTVHQIRSVIHLATKEDLDNLQTLLMPLIDDFRKFATDQKAFNDRQAVAIDSLVNSINGLTTDVQTLDDKITALENAAGNAETPDDVKALIGEVAALSDSNTTKAEAAAQAAQALDAQTPPPTPKP